MKKTIRLISMVCVICVTLCHLTGVVWAADMAGESGLIEPQYITYPDIDGGGAVPGETLIWLHAKQVTDFLESNDSYIGRTYFSGTDEFGCMFTLYHSYASTTNYYRMRGGICYYDFTQNKYVPLNYIDSSRSGETEFFTIQKKKFTQDRLYYGYIKNLTGGYVYGDLWFYRVLS